MTYLSATSAMIEIFAREAAPSLNPEMDMAARQQAAPRSGGLVSWLGQTAIGKALSARKADRDLNIAVKRLAELSPHLLADIGMLDTTAMAEEMPRTDEQIARTQVALRPAQRPAIQISPRAPARSTTKPPVRAAGKEQRVTR